MITFRVLLQTHTHQSKFIKNFTSIDTFNDWKVKRLESSCKYIKYSIKHKGEAMYGTDITEYGKDRDGDSKDAKAGIEAKKKKWANATSNIVQTLSRNNNIALRDNDLISLSMTPPKQRRLMKWINSDIPITPKEISIIKSLFLYKRLSLSQYNLIKDIETCVSRRVRM